MSTEYEKITEIICPEDFKEITGVVYEVGGLPPWMGDDALAEFLSPGNTIMTIKGTRTRGWKEQEQRSFLIKTHQPVVWKHKQGEGFLATCNVAVRKPLRKPSTQMFQLHKKRSSFPPLERSNVRVAVAEIK